MALDAQRNWTASMADDLRRVTARPAAAALPAPLPPSPIPFQPSQPAPHLPIEVLLLIFEYLGRLPGVQSTLCACTLVSRSWSEAATPSLYASPQLSGPNYDLFTRTICPSINVSVRKSPLSTLVKDLDLSMLVHQGSKSVTARLLGRTKGSLERFVAPVASLGLNCFPALAKCALLRDLDLSLVSEAINLHTLFDTVAGMSRLERLRLPRSAGFGAHIDPAHIQWPTRLRSLTLSGGLDHEFWAGQLRLPGGTEEVCVTHCPKLDHGSLALFLDTLGSMKLQNLYRLEFANLPHLTDVSLNLVLSHVPHLPCLSVSMDYVSPEMLNPFGVAWGTITEGTPYDPLHRGPLLGLRILELTDSGDAGDPDKFMPLDVHMAAVDYRTVPVLEQVLVVGSLTAWFSDEEEESLDLLNDYLKDRARERGESDVQKYGVKRIGPVMRR